ncbi:MAG: hypothetical protein U0T83_03620 [Bacteriovoracaceae bacterium]
MNFYYCSQCKEINYHVEQLLFVEPSLSKGFCSEECLLEFYGPLMNYFEQLDLDNRKKLKLVEEDIYSLRGTEFLLEETLKKFEQHLVLKNRINEEYHFFVKKINSYKKIKTPFYVLVIAFVLEDKASLVLFHTVTNESLLIEKLTANAENITTKKNDEAKAKNDSSGTVNYMNINLKKEVVDLIDQKKSSMLADLLSKRSNADIPFEDFHIYDQFGTQTLAEPDELYRYDDEGEEFFVYIKTHSVQNRSFYYFIICLYYTSNEEQMQDILIPILSFPSVDPKIYQEYKKGEQITGTLKN